MPTDKTQLLQKETQRNAAAVPSGTSKNLVRSLLGLPERRSLKAGSYTPMPPVGFRYPEISDDRKITSSPLSFGATEDISEEIMEQQGENSTVFRNFNPHPLPPYAKHKEDSAQTHFTTEKTQAESRRDFQEKDNRDNELSAMSMEQQEIEGFGTSGKKQTFTSGSDAVHAELTAGNKKQKKATAHTDQDKRQAKTIPSSLPETDHPDSMEKSKQRPEPETVTSTVRNSPTVQQEIEVPGISEEKQVFTSLSDAAHVDLMAGSKKQNEATSHTGQDKRQAETVPSSLPATNHPVSVLAVAREKSKQQPKPGKYPHTEQTKPETVTGEVRNSPTVQQELQMPGNAKSASAAVGQITPIAVAGTQKLSPVAHNNVPQDLSATAGIDKGKTSPAAFTPQGAPLAGTDKIAQLRQSFHELMTKKLDEQKKINDQTTVSEPSPSQEDESRQQPAIHQVVVVQRSGGARGKMQPAAYWERSYAGRSWMKMVR